MAKEKLFYWRGQNRLQQKQRGMIIAENRQQAEQLLFERGIQQVTLQQNWQLWRNIKKKDICDLLTQLSTLLNATIPLNQSLHILWLQTTNIALYQWLKSILTHIENGFSFSQAVATQSNYLTAQEQQLINVGELTGQLAEVCQQIALQRQQQIALQQKLQKILLYPLVVLAISIILTILLLWFIVPQFALMYKQEADLPLFTTILLSLSDYLQQYGLISLFILISLFLLFSQCFGKSLWFHYQKAKWLSYLPMINQFIAQVRLIRFCQAMWLMLQAGIPIQQALQSFLPQQKNWQVNSVKNYDDPLLTTEIKQILFYLQQGHYFSDCISEQFFPVQARKMLQIGEKSGKLIFMLQQIERYYRRQIEHKMDLFAQLLEPLLMIIIGGLIGIIMLGMYLPIFNMGNLL